ncbi:MAG TPA: BMP family ABC transporter substrate-binding protein [Methanocorpusculum sp.]|nr:BMP family ABC transporter substrate-binding protein [Methanocorpusculum sp.]
MDRRLLIVIGVVILLAIPASLLLASGDLFPKEEEPYYIAVIADQPSAHTTYVSRSVAGAQSAMRLSDRVLPEMFISPTSDEADILQEINDACVLEYNLVFGPGYNLNEAMEKASHLHPEMFFLTIDGGFTEFGPNFSDIQFRDNESSMAAGYVAGMTSESNIIGFLGGYDNLTIQRFYYGFLAGANVASREKQVEIRVIDVYADSYLDSDKGYELTKQLYGDGADIVFTVAGDTGLGGIEAAKEMGKYVIGVDVDQNYLAPDNVIFSVVKNIAPVVADVLAGYSEGKYSGTGVISVGYSEGAMDLVSFTDAVSESVIAREKELTGYIRDGVFAVPSTAEEYKAWSVFMVPAFT